MPRRKTRRRGNGEGSIFQLKDGSWRGKIPLGYDYRTGRPRYRWHRAASEKEVVAWYRQHVHLASSRLIQQPERVTVSEWLERFILFRSSEVRPRTVENYRHYQGKISEALGQLPLHKLSAFHLQDFYRELADRGLSPSVRRHIHHFLKAALHDAQRHRLIERNPSEVIDAPKGGRLTLPRVWERGEVVRFLAAARNERLYGAFYLMLATGLRIGEVLGLRWSDLQGEQLHVRRTLRITENRPSFGPPKTARGHRVIFLNQEDLIVLAERKHYQRIERDLTSRWHDHDLIFSSTVGTPINHHNLRRAYRRIVGAAGLPRIRIHDLRHTYITLARDAGVDAEVLADRVGQDVRVTMSIYSQMTEARRRKAALSLKVLVEA